MIGTRGVIGQRDNGEDNLSGVQPSDRKIMAELKLIAQPEKFDGKSIRLIGFLSIEFEGTALYLHREDFDHGIPLNGVWIDIPSDMTERQKRDVTLRYVICAGVFSASNHGHMDMFSGAITNIRRLEFWSDEPRSTKAVFSQ